MTDKTFQMAANCSQETAGACSSAGEAEKALRKEEEIRHKTDENGVRWFKVYFGGGAHFQNWLSQAREIFGKDQLLIEEVPMPALKCFHDAQETAYRIWVKDKTAPA